MLALSIVRFMPSYIIRATCTVFAAIKKEPAVMLTLDNS